MANNVVRIQILGDSSSATRAMQSTESSLRRLEGTAQQANAGVGRINDTFDKFAQVGAIAAGGAAITAALNDVVQSASRLQQSQGAIDAVFKGNAAAMHEAAKAANDLGLSQSAYGEYATKLGSQLKNLGVAQSQVVPQTQELIKLGTDLAATYGGDVGSAIDAVSALFLGETDPIERYGVTIKQATVDAKASAEGLTDVQARMALLYEQSADAQGQWAREQDTYAVQSQKAAAAFEDMKAALGGAFLPALTKVMEVFGALAGVVQKIPGPVLEAAIQLGAIGVAMKLIGPYGSAAMQALSGLAQSVMSVGDPLSKTNVKLEQFRGALGTLGVAAAIYAFQQLQQSVQDGTTSVEAFTDALTRGQDAMRMTPTETGFAAFLTNATDLESTLDRISENQLVRLSEGLGQLQGDDQKLQNYITALKDLAAQDTATTTAKLQELRQAMEARGMDTSQLSEVEQALTDAGASAQAAGEGVQTYGDKLQATAQRTQELTQATQDALAPLRELQGLVLGKREASNAWNESIIRATESLRENGATLAKSTEAGIANRRALDQMAESGFKFATSTNNVGVAANRMRQVWESTIQAAEAMGMSRKQAEAYADQLKLIPKDIRTLMKNNAKEATGDVNTLTAAINAIPTAKNVDIFINQRVSGSATATGGGFLSGLFGNDEIPPDAIPDITVDIPDDPYAAQDDTTLPNLGGSGQQFGRYLTGAKLGDLVVRVPVTYDLFMKEWKIDKTEIESAIKDAQGWVEHWREAVNNTERTAADKENKAADRIKRLRDRYNDLMKARKDRLSEGITKLMDPTQFSRIHESSNELLKGLKISEKMEARQAGILDKIGKIGKAANRTEKTYAKGLKRDQRALTAAELELEKRQALSDEMDRQLRIRQQYIKYVEEELAAIGQLASKINGVSLADAFADADKQAADLTKELDDMRGKLADAWHPSHIDYWSRKIRETEAQLGAINPAAAVNAQLQKTLSYNYALIALKNKGASQGLIDEIIGTGVDKGADIAKALVNDDAMRAQFEHAIAMGLAVSQNTAVKLRDEVYAPTYAGTLEALKAAYTDFEAWGSSKNIGKVGGTVINVTGAIDPASVARQIQKILREEQKRNGK